MAQGVEFDHNSQQHSEDPVASYRALREKCPVAWTEAHGGYWVMSGLRHRVRGSA